MPDTDYNDRLKDYVQVKDRIVALYELFGTARIETLYELTIEPDDRPKVIARALVYRTPDDPHPSTGTSWLYLPGTTPYTRGSEIENAETSAIGRAIGFLGILIDKSIASANEIAGKQDDTPGGPPDASGATEHLLGIDSVQGTVRLGSAAYYKLELKETPDGPAFGFRLERATGDAIPQVVVQGDAARAVVERFGDPKNLKDVRVRVKGRLVAVRADGKKTFNRLHVTEIAMNDWRYPDDQTLPADASPGMTEPQVPEAAVAPSGLTPQTPVRPTP